MTTGDWDTVEEVMCIMNSVYCTWLHKTSTYPLGTKENKREVIIIGCINLGILNHRLLLVDANDADYRFSPRNGRISRVDFGDH